MLRNYLTVAFRVLLRNKIYVAINLFSLGFALACCLLAYLHYDYRASFDQTHAHTDSIYRLNSLRKVDGGTQPWAVSPAPLAEAVVQNFPGAQRYTRLFGSSALVMHKGNVFPERLHYTDPNTFLFFNLPLQAGSYPAEDQPSGLLLSQALALKYFRPGEAVGQELVVVDAEGEEKVFTVQGVLEKVPANSSLQLDMVTSFENLFTSGRFRRHDWTSQGLVTAFVEVKDEHSAQNLGQQLLAYTSLHNQAHPDWQIAGFSLQPFREIAASSDVDMPGYVYGSPLTANPRGVLVIVPALMSFFILLITCFNFTNISLAFASGRLKEIGIRKVMGSRRPQLIGQFLTENILLCFVASFLALLFIRELLPLFNASTGLELRLGFGSKGGLWVFLLGLPLLTALVAGLYPAVYLSSFQPVTVLKGKTALGASSGFTRFLLTAQFSLSCFALIVGFLMTQNAAYQEKADFGYALEEVAVVELQETGAFEALSKALRENPKIERVAGAAHQIGTGSYPATVRGEFQEVKAQVAHVGGEEYLQAMGVKLRQGRHFHPGKGLDQDASVIVNQTLVEALGLADPVGQKIRFDSTSFTIVGVVEDYKEFGLHGLVPPCVLRLAQPEEFNYLVVRARNQDLAQVQEFLRSTWHTLVPNKPFHGFRQTELTEKERYLNEGFTMVAFFLAIVTLLLSASGLFALVSLNIIRRKKEIAVRKILGASWVQLVALMNRDFIRILFLAFVVGSGLGYLLVSKLIFTFIYVYHAPIGPAAFLSTLGVVFLSCCLTVGIKVYRATRVNPVKHLQAE